jgi:hypothetical protein
MHLKKAFPSRYGVLTHPGDAWSFDIFSRAGTVLRGPEGSALLGSLPARLLAVGESQSASFLVTYVNGIDPLAAVFDGFLVHSRGGIPAGLDGIRIRDVRPEGDGARGSATLAPECIRDDARVPVLVLQTETDVLVLGAGMVAQPDGPKVRLWEVAGAAHADTYLVRASFDDDGSLSAARLAELLQPTAEILGMHVSTPINAAPQHHYVAQCALEHLDRWSSGGAPPPAAPRLTLTAGGSSFQRDEQGNVIGGVRTPWVDVAVATLSGIGERGGVFSQLFGTTELFPPAVIGQRFPGGLPDYLAAFERALDASIDTGFLLTEDRDEMREVAAAAFVDWLEPGNAGRPGTQ